MSVEEQKDIISQLAERQKGPWLELTDSEKKAAHYISYGTWGPRKPIHPDGEWTKIFTGVAGALVVATCLFFVGQYFSEGLGVTMNREWQEKSDEILKEKKSNPFRGYSQVQTGSRH